MSRAGILLLAAIYPSAMAWLYFVAASPSAAAPSTRNVLAIALFTAGKAIQFAFPLVWFRLVEGHLPRLRRPRSAGLLGGLLFGALVAVGAWAIYRAVLRSGQLIPVEIIAGRIRAKMVEFGLSEPAAYLGFALFLSAIHSFLEEYYWRWFLFGRLAERVALGPAVAISSLAFAAHHLIDLGVFFPGYFWTLTVPLSGAVAMGGAFWAWLYARSRSLYGPWLSHALVDAALMAIGYDLIFLYGRV